MIQKMLSQTTKFETMAVINAVIEHLISNYILLINAR